jgi:hypothetical protein
MSDVTAGGLDGQEGAAMNENQISETVEVIVVESEDALDYAITRICEAAGNLTVIRAGDGFHYLPWETEHGDTWAIRPVSEDEYDREVGGHQSVTMHLDSVPLPWTLVTEARRG